MSRRRLLPFPFPAPTRHRQFRRRRARPSSLRANLRHSSNLPPSPLGQAVGKGEPERERKRWRRRKGERGCEGALPGSRFCRDRQSVLRSPSVSLNSARFWLQLKISLGRSFLVNCCGTEFVVGSDLSDLLIVFTSLRSQRSVQ